MKKLLILTFLLLSVSLFASPSIYLRAGYSFSFDTNIFSYPLVRRYDDKGLDFRTKNPYIYRLDSNIKVATEIFFKSDGRTGLSFLGELGFPMKATTYTPSTTDSSSDWTYLKADATKGQLKKVFFGFGPSFRLPLSKFDLGCNIRLTAGSYTHFKNELILGLNTEAFMNYFFNETCFMFTNVDLNAQFINFYLDRNSSMIYRDNYVMASVSASIGFGLKFGPRG